MNDLTIKNKYTGNYTGDYYILTKGFEGSRNLIKITNKQANKLVEAINQKEKKILNINNSFYSVDDIRKILTEHERNNLF